MRIDSIKQHQYNTSHKAVIRKYFLKAVESYKWFPGSALGTIPREILIDAHYKFITRKDAIDTLRAIMPYATGATKAIYGTIELIEESIKKYPSI